MMYFEISVENSSFFEEIEKKAHMTSKFINENYGF